MRPIVPLLLLLAFISGAVPYAYLLPRWLRKVDVRRESLDGNPGVYNAFRCSGLLVGLLCVPLEFGKGFLPVYAARHILPIDSILFSFVMLAPVLGHAFSPFLHFRGGKAVAASFGVLLGLLPALPLCPIPAVLYLCLLPLRIRPNERMTAIVFLAFGALLLFLPIPGAVRLGGGMVCAVVVAKNLPDALPAHFLAAAYNRLFPQ